MNHLSRKLKSKKGESLVEILIAILIVAFGCVLIATMYSSAMNLNLTAAEEDDAYYKALSEMEQMFEGTGDGSGKAVITDSNGKDLEVTINTYGDDKNAAYKRP